MVMLVTLQQASDHLRRDTSDDDSDLTLKIHAASHAILNYLKDTGVAYEYELNSDGSILFDSAGEPVYIMDSDGSFIPLPEVQAAVLIMLGVLYTDRDAQQYINPKSGGNIERLGNMSLPRAVHFLLDPLRVPTLE